MGSQIGDPDEITVLVTGFGVCYCCNVLFFLILSVICLATPLGATQYSTAQRSIQRDTAYEACADLMRL
jgi:hypothetical protein